MSRLRQNAPVIEAFASLAMALVAAFALIGVKLQIDAQDRTAREQSAREIYREFLAITVANPDLAAPDACMGLLGPDNPAYDAYLEYLLYTAEQTTGLDADWDPVIGRWLDNHASVLCAIEDWSGYTPEVEALIKRTRLNICATAPACN